MRVIAASTDDLDSTRASDDKFEYLEFVSDRNATLGEAFEIMHYDAPRQVERQIYAPTYFLLDSSGKVVWLKRAEALNKILKPDPILATIDELGLAKPESK